MIKPQDGDLRVWHIPQIPGNAFFVRVASFEEADLVLRVLAEYDLFQLHNRIKPDYSSAQGVEVYRFADVIGEDWEEVEDDEIGRDNPTDYSDRFDLEANRTDRRI